MNHILEGSIPEECFSEPEQNIILYPLPGALPSRCTINLILDEYNINKKNKGKRIKKEGLQSGRERIKREELEIKLFGKKQNQKNNKIYTKYNKIYNKYNNHKRY